MTWAPERFKKQNSAEVLADLAKAYEGVNRQLLVEQSGKRGYPLEVLYTSLTSYQWDRRLVYGKLTSKKISTTMGHFGRSYGSHV